MRIRKVEERTQDTERLNLADVAERVGMSVNSARWYQQRDLILPPEQDGSSEWYGDAHVECLIGIRDLERQGFTPAAIHLLLTGRLYVPPGVETPELLTAEELSAESGVPQELIDSVIRVGLLVPRTHKGEPRFTDADLNVLAAGLRLLEIGLPVAELLGLARRHAEAVRPIAESAVAMYENHLYAPLRQRGLTAEERAAFLVDTFCVLFPAGELLVTSHFARVLLQIAQDHLEAMDEPKDTIEATEEATRILERSRLT